MKQYKTNTKWHQASFWTSDFISCDCPRGPLGHHWCTNPFFNTRLTPTWLQNATQTSNKQIKSVPEDPQTYKKLHLQARASASKRRPQLNQVRGGRGASRKGHSWPSQTVPRVSTSCFLEDVEPIFKIFKNLLNGSSGCFGLRLFRNLQNAGVPRS